MNLALIGPWLHLYALYWLLTMLYLKLRNFLKKEREPKNKCFPSPIPRWLGEQNLGLAPVWPQGNTLATTSPLQRLYTSLARNSPKQTI